MKIGADLVFTIVDFQDMLEESQTLFIIYINIFDKPTNSKINILYNTMIYFQVEFNCETTPTTMIQTMAKLDRNPNKYNEESTRINKWLCWEQRKGS